METRVEIPLCEYENELGRHRLYAVLDELTLTYRVVISCPDGRTRALFEHVPSRQEARRRAAHYRYKALLASGRPIPVAVAFADDRTGVAHPDRDRVARRRQLRRAVRHGAERLSQPRKRRRCVAGRGRHRPAHGRAIGSGVSATRAVGRKPIARFATALCDARSLRLGQELALPAGARAKAMVRMAREERADLVALAASDIRGSERIYDLARALLDDGVAVLAVPAGDHRSWRPARIGLGYDGSPPADAALAIARRLLEAGRGEVGRLDIAYVDDSASASYESDGEVIASRRGAVIEWWLGDLVEHLPARVRPLRLIGDPAVELAELSDDLDLLVIGTRGRASLRRALTGSASRALIARARCPLLVVPTAAGVPRAADAHASRAACVAATREI